MFAWCSNTRSLSVDPDKASIAELTAREASLSSLTGTCIGSVTFYDGDPVAATAFFKDRVARLLVANPWLGGALDKRNGKGAIAYDPASPNPEVFQVGAVPSLWGAAKHVDRLNACRDALAPYICRNGPGTDAPFFRLSVLTERPMEEMPTAFALVTTLSHVVGDGHTYYALHKMLDADAKVVPLNPIRVPDLDAKEKELANGMESYFSCMISMIMNMVFRPKRPVVVYEVDVEALNSRKQALAQEGGVDFVSTNDILTAAFFQATSSDVSFMAINLRNRVEGFTDELAGNYQSLIWYRPSDVSPALLRRSLTPRPGFYRAGEPQTEFPSFGMRMRGRVANVTNWATFYGDVRPPGADQTMHIPIIDWEMNARVMNQCIVFRPASNRLSLICAIYPDAQAAFEAALGGALRKV